jgi:hypothetical protein
MFYGLLMAVVVALTAQSAMAQSTIMNIPTTDTAAKGKVYVEFDFLPQAPGPDGGPRTYVYNPRIVVGVSDRVEVGANFLTFHTTGSTTGFFQPNIKFKLYNNDDAGVVLSAGGILNTPMNHRDSLDSFGAVYGTLSKKVKSGNYGPRFHVGPYGVIASETNTSFAGPRGGVILGYEQPIHSKVSIVADWFSGKNFYGYFTPGVSFTLPASSLLNMGYSIGNDSWENSNATKNRYFFIYYGITF